MALTASKLHYIKAIHELAGDGEGARVSDIAARLSVSKPSVCAAVGMLQADGLVRRDDSHRVWLTAKGARQAVANENRLAAIRRFLTEVLGVDEATADADAFALCHLVSMDTLSSIMEYQGYLKHGCSGSALV